MFCHAIFFRLTQWTYPVSDADSVEKTSAHRNNYTVSKNIDSFTVVPPL